MNSRMPGVVAGTALVYGLIYLLIYRTQPLGQLAVLDGREILDLASAYARGSTPSEPFYRAPLYPFLLSLPLRIGLPDGMLMATAQVLNVLCHAISAGLVYRIAERLYGSNRSAMLAGMLYALYPVAVFFAGEPLDIALSTTLMLGSLWWWIRGFEENAARTVWIRCLVAGGLMALAFASRPQMLAVAGGVALISPLLVKPHRVAGLGFASGLTGGLLIFGLVNLWLNDDFVVLPTQGGYNLWAANGPEANGFYFAHSLPVFAVGPNENPNRYEARYLYLQDNDLDPGSPVDDQIVSRYWSARTIGHVLERPGQWLGLASGKIAALLHNHEQYNNKTFLFHKQRNPILKFNPLSWTPLLALAALGLAVSGLDRRRAALLVVVASYGAGLVLSYASGRFRLPLATILCIFAGGIVATGVSARWRNIRVTVPAALTTLALLVFGFWPFTWARPEATFAEDWMLLASTQYRLGRNGDALASLDQALSLDIEQPKVWHLRCSVGFNSLLDRLVSDPQARPDDRLNESCDRAARISRSSTWANGVLMWVTGRSEDAEETWRGLTAQDDPDMQRAMASLILTGRASTADIDRVQALAYDQRVAMLLFAGEILGDARAVRYLESRYVPQWLDSQRRLYRHMFAARANTEPDSQGRQQ